MPVRDTVDSNLESSEEILYSDLAIEHYTESESLSQFVLRFRYFTHIASKRDIATWRNVTIKKGISVAALGCLASSETPQRIGSSSHLTTDDRYS